METHEELVVSQKRVVDFGEVYTSPSMVNTMLDQIRQETERIESRFFEPACGTGNFLAEILRRKLAIVVRRYGNSQLEFERYSVLSVCSIYGIDKLKDNVLECRKRLYEIFMKSYKNSFESDCKLLCIESIQYILQKNVLFGDALSLTNLDRDKDPIIFAEWTLVNGSMIKRRDYTLANLLTHKDTEGATIISDIGNDVFIPHPIKEYPLTHFWDLPSHA